MVKTYAKVIIVSYAVSWLVVWLGEWTTTTGLPIPAFEWTPFLFCVILLVFEVAAVGKYVTKLIDNPHL